MVSRYLNTVLGVSVRVLSLGGCFWTRLILVWIEWVKQIAFPKVRGLRPTSKSLKRTKQCWTREFCSHTRQFCFPSTLWRVFFFFIFLVIPHSDWNFHHWLIWLSGLPTADLGAFSASSTMWANSLW